MPHPSVVTHYGDQQPILIEGTPATFFTGGSPDVLVYRALSPDHWHFVSDGIRETYEDPETGSELTLRVPRSADEDAPPEWAVEFFVKVATHFLNSSVGFAVGHHLEIRGSLRGLPFALGAADPDLHPSDDASGTSFVQLIGIADDELSALMDWDARKFTAILERENPRLVTKLDRASILTEPRTRQEIEEGTARDGSSMDSAYTAHVSFQRDGEGVRVELDHAVVPTLGRLLRGRTLHGRSFHVESFADGTRIHFAPAKEPSWRVDEALWIELDDALANAIREDLQTEGSSKEWPGLPGLVLTVVTPAEDDELDDDESRRS